MHSHLFEEKYQLLDGELINKWLNRIKRGFLHTTILKIYGTKDKKSKNTVLSGSEVVNIIHSQSLDHWKPSPGSLYPILKEMENDKLILKIQSENKKEKSYRITDKGNLLLDLVTESSLLITGPTEYLSREMPEDVLNDTFYNLYKDFNVDELISVQKFHLKLANIAGDMIKSLNSISNK